ncbi:MAG TPA: hypothetical protein P5550_00980, partial [Bacteroidales bacterium]|nr:hypothetical protein [Bacteroidales bacterium]
VTVTDAQGCSAIAQTIVTVRPGPLVGAGPDDTLTIGQSHLFAQASASGTGPMTFAWFPSFTVADPGALHAVATPYVTSEYSLFVTDAYGCTHSDTALLVVLPQGNTLSGRLMYAADPAFALPGVKVVMLDIAAKTADTTSTDNQGVFRFVNLPSGSYVMEGVSGQAAGYGAVNATDALGVMLHFAGVQPLTDLPLKAGDVNLASGVNSTDALHIGQYFSGLLPEFAAGDWTFESDTFVFSAQTFHSRTFQALLTGDVNASYDVGTKSRPAESVEYDGQIQAGMGEILRLPLSLDQDAELGALSVHLILPAGLELTGLDLAPGVAGHLSYGKTGPLVRIAW